MAIPKYSDYFPAVMGCLKDKDCQTSREITNFCAKYFNLTEEEISEKLQSGQPIYANRIGWAITYLSKAGLRCKVKRGAYSLTDEGKKSIKNGCDKITLKYLAKYDSFNEFFGNKPHKGTDNQALGKNDEILQSPAEMLDNAIRTLNSNLSDDLLEEVLKMNPYEFESLVVKLLIKMGYGKLHENKDAVTKKSGDGGIDGVVTADKFGFDSVYTQAKHWNKDRVVHRPDIQTFLGALAGQGATKGLFITTSSFSKGAIEFAQKQLHQKIVLVDGKELANLMIEYNLGVSVVETYEVKRVDMDFFEDE